MIPPKTRKYLLIGTISAFVGILYFVYLYFSKTGDYPGITKLFLPYLVSIAISVIISFSVFFSDHQLNRAIGWTKRPGFRFVTGWVINSILAMTIALAGSWWYLGNFHATLDPEILWNKYEESGLKLLILIGVGMLIYSVIYLALFSYNQYAIAQIRSAKQDRKQLALQFEALKGQLSPHYLFNCLNTISSLIYKDVHLAEDFIRRLAQTYQYILDTNDKNFVALEEEVEFVKSYNYLLKVRFENNLQLDINLPPNVMKSKIPPLTLQMLVENAVKHNTISKEHPLYIYITAQDNSELWVINTKTEAPKKINSFNVGLDNIRNRYRLLTERAIKVEDDQKFTVQLPILEDREVNVSDLKYLA